MAKGKHAAALFEVIQAARQKEQLRAKGGGFLTPSWWFKGRNKAAAKPQAASEPPPQPAPQPAPQVIFEKPAPVVPSTKPAAPNMIRSEPDAPAEEAIDDSGPHPFESSDPVAPKMDGFVDNEEPALHDPKPAAAASAADGSSGKSRTIRSAKRPVRLNYGGQQINLRLTYTSAAISAFGLMVVVGLAFLVGKTLSRGPASAGAASINAVKNGPVLPGVLTPVAGRSSSNDDEAISSKPRTSPPTPAQKNPITPPKNGQTTQHVDHPQTTPTTPQPAPQPTPAPSGLGPNGKRIVGMQYVWIQSYPDPEDANDAVEALAKAGIQATAEKGIWLAPGWSCVVGTRAFDHTRNNPEFEAYAKAIKDVSNSFAAQSKFRRFDPKPVGWREQK